jgi:hypothetical protein
LPIYHAYLFDEEDSVSLVYVVEAEDDGGVIERAEELADGHAVEIWDGIRLIVRLPEQG